MNDPARIEPLSSVKYSAMAAGGRVVVGRARGLRERDPDHPEDDGENAGQRRQAVQQLKPIPPSSTCESPPARATERPDATRRPGRLERALGVRAEDREHDALERHRLVLSHCCHHEPRALVEREASDAGAERGKRQRTRSELVRHLEHAARRSRDELGGGAQILAHDRPVNHVLRLERSRPRSPRPRRPESGRAPTASRSISAPPARLIAPATPAPIQRWSFAAFAIASTSSAVMSPSTTSIRTEET